MCLILIILIIVFVALMAGCGCGMARHYHASKCGSGLRIHHIQTTPTPDSSSIDAVRPSSEQPWQPEQPWQLITDLAQPIQQQIAGDLSTVGLVPILTAEQRDVMSSMTRSDVDDTWSSDFAYDRSGGGSSQGSVNWDSSFPVVNPALGAVRYSRRRGEWVPVGNAEAVAGVVGNSALGFGPWSMGGGGGGAYAPGSVGLQQRRRRRRRRNQTPLQPSGTPIDPRLVPPPPHQVPLPPPFSNSLVFPPMANPTTVGGIGGVEPNLIPTPPQGVDPVLDFLNTRYPTGEIPASDAQLPEVKASGNYAYNPFQKRWMRVTPL